MSRKYSNCWKVTLSLYDPSESEPLWMLFVVQVEESDAFTKSTAMLLAAANGHSEVVQALLEKAGEGKKKMVVNQGRLRAVLLFLLDAFDSEWPRQHFTPLGGSEWTSRRLQDPCGRRSRRYSCKQGKTHSV